MAFEAPGYSISNGRVLVRTSLRREGSRGRTGYQKGLALLLNDNPFSQKFLSKAVVPTSTPPSL